MRLLIAALLLLVVGANADVYSVSVRWASDFDPLWVNIVISTVSDTGVVTDLGTIDSGLWSEYVYYPGERSSALSIDGTKYYYSIWNPINTGAVLYTYDLKKNKVTSKVAIPFQVANSNGQPIRSMNSIDASNLAVLYGNVLAFIDPATGNLNKKIVVWDQYSGTNSTKQSTFDPATKNIYIQARNLRDAGRPCQYTYTVNVASGATSKCPCVPAARGFDDLIDGIWPNPYNSSTLIAAYSNILGVSIGYYNPATGAFGAEIFPYDKFAARSLEAIPSLNTFNYNPSTDVFSIHTADKQEADSILVFGVPSGNVLSGGEINTAITMEGWEAVPE